ncbi:MAG TPA: acyl-CoA dehydrogenase [Stellaceae bacterium]|jgi:alkylation response protein AidB-like acyl-CoA dehydrogenase|nr:acyl-CoA dehydrogenase [Stellaceae bacterium]
MTPYAAPLADLRFALEESAGLAEIAQLPGCEAATPEIVDSILAEAGKFAAAVLAPLNAVGDRNPSRLANGAVETPPGFKEAYRDFIAGGWNGIALPEEAGGQGLPLALGTAVLEIWTSANLAFSLCPVLTWSAAELLIAHGSPEQRASYLAKIVSGEWTGTMNLTEPQAGSDLGALRCRAIKDGAQYRISGEKIFITWGEHDLAPNIVHMVLARISGAPQGTKGLSLFVVPKFLVTADGTLGARNDVRCLKLEEKLGIHASPTCVLRFGEEGGAMGTLIGEEGRGLEYMFLMMNAARLNVGLQGVAIAERALQQARGFARERVQGKPVDAAAGASALIIHHPDVRRMLLQLRADAEATRALVYHVAGALDRARHHPDAAERRRQQQRADLLIPVAKAWATETGFACASTNIQVHGGMGYIEETGAAQHLRDARIALIYEGTNGIQANDLLGRKVVRDEGAAMRALLDEMRALEPALSAAPDHDLRAVAQHLHAGIATLATLTDDLIARHRTSPTAALAGAVPYLNLCGVVIGGWLLAKGALAAARALAAGGGDAGFLGAKLKTARFFAEQRLALAPGLAAAVKGGEAILDFDLERL